MRVGTPATVRLVLYVPESPPSRLDNASLAAQATVVVAPKPGLTPYVYVILDASGVEIKAVQVEAEQPLDASKNIWLWTITASSELQFSLKPEISVRYYDDKKNLVAQVPARMFQSDFAVSVAGDEAVDAIGALIEKHLGNAIALLLGMPGTILSVRSLRSPEPAKASSPTALSAQDSSQLPSAPAARSDDQTRTTEKG